MIMVDQAIWPHKGKRWAHLISHESFEELHLFAERLGLSRSRFQGDHYDVDTDLRDAAIDLDADSVDFREVAKTLKSAGLRRR